MKDIITLSQKRLIGNPNLSDYKKEYSRFSFSDLSRYPVEPIPSSCNIGEYVIDKHTKTWRKNKIALIYQNDEGDVYKFTFNDLSKLSNQVANVLKEYEIRKGQRVFLFLPKIPILYYGVVGVAKIGAIFGCLFPAFGEQALIDRLKNSGAGAVITNKTLGQRIEKIKRKLPDLKHILYVDGQFGEKIAKAPTSFKPVKRKKEHPLFMLYTSATGNTPVCGIVIPNKSLVEQCLSAYWVLDLKDEDIYWCTADPGWVTGTVYGLLAPWALGATQFVYEGRFDAKTWYSLIEKYQITVWYSAPTAFRMLASKDNAHKGIDLGSLRHIVSVGEALPASVVSWALKTFKRPIHDTYWQTETGSMVISNFPSVPIKSGSMGKPLPGITAAIINENGKELEVNKEGEIALIKGWPSMMSKVWKNEKRYKSYFKGKWFLTGDRGYKDKDGYFWFVGRGNDVIKTSGERIGPFEVESAIQEHPSVLESAVIGKPDKLRGEIIKAFIVLKRGRRVTKDEIVSFVKTKLAGHAYPREIDFVISLPKNRSGKIVRRILKAKELGLPLGDTSTLIS